MNEAEFLAKAGPLVYPDDPELWTEDAITLELAEPGWPDANRWGRVWIRIKDGGELTEGERGAAIAYINAGEDFPPDDARLPLVTP